MLIYVPNSNSLDGARRLSKPLKVLQDRAVNEVYVKLTLTFRSNFIFESHNSQPNSFPFSDNQNSIVVVVVVVVVDVVDVVIVVVVVDVVVVDVARMLHSVRIEHRFPSFKQKVCC